VLNAAKVCLAVVPPPFSARPLKFPGVILYNMLFAPAPAKLVRNAPMRVWRNWQTRRIQVPVPVKGVEVRFLSPALSQPTTYDVWLAFLLRCQRTLSKNAVKERCQRTLSKNAVKERCQRSLSKIAVEKTLEKKTL
jgi:hypothetical protein